MSEFGDEAVQRLKTMGFDLPGRPPESPMVLDDVTDLDDSSLMAEFVLLTAWADYAYTQLALAAIDERDGERGLAMAEAQHWKSYRTAKSSVSEAKAMMPINEEVLEAQDDLDRAHAYRKLLVELAAKYERDAAVFSRELTRRTSFAGQSRKERAVP